MPCGNQLAERCEQGKNMILLFWGTEREIKALWFTSLPAELHVLSQKLCIDFKNLWRDNCWFPWQPYLWHLAFFLHVGDIKQRKAPCDGFRCASVAAMDSQEKTQFILYLENLRCYIVNVMLWPKAWGHVKIQICYKLGLSLECGWICFTHQTALYFSVSPGAWMQNT